MDKDEDVDMFDLDSNYQIDLNKGNKNETNKDDDFFDVNIFTSDIITQPIDTNSIDMGYRSQSQESSSNISNYIMIEHRLSVLNEFEVKTKNLDINLEASNFICKPHDENNVFYPNFDYFEAKLTSKSYLMDIRKSIRNALENELERSQRCEMLTKNQSNNVQNNDDKREQSPDIFKDYENEMEICEMNHCVEEKENKVDAKNLNLPSNLLKTDIEVMETYPKYEIDKPNENLILNLAMKNSETNEFMVEDGDNISTRRKELINKVENFIIKLLEDLVNKGSIDFYIRQKMKLDNYDILNGILTLKPNIVCSQKNISACNLKGEHNFSLIMYILSEIYHLLITGLTCTVRELYYKDTVLAENQINISNAIKDICCLFDCAPWEFGIMSSCKGLISGPILITLSNGEILDCSLNMGGTILPYDTVNIQKIQTTAEYVLLVEKDTVFEKLLKNNILSALGKHIILMTGKGFPDINTRVMLKKIWEQLKIPIYGLFDPDPFGVEILLVYRYGSRAMGFSSDALACPFIRWIGIHPSEINILTISSVNLNVKDKYKIKAILKRNYVNEEIKNELKVMEKINRKAEIEGLLCSSCSFFINDYLPNKIKNNFVI